MSSLLPPKQKRIFSVDVVRGCAMILIIFAHSRALIDQSSISHATWVTLLYATNISTVTFTFVNGTMLTYFFCTKPSWWGVYKKFAKRALLLFACHPLIKIISYPSHSDEATFWHYFFVDFPITDTIAICLLITPLLSRYLPPFRRLVVILAMLTISPLVVGLVEPQSEIGKIFINVFFGFLGWHNPDVFFPFPIIPWLAIDLCGSFVGEALAKRDQNKLSSRAFSKFICQSSFILLATSVLIIIGYKLLKLHSSISSLPALQEAIYPSKTTGLLPAYLSVIMLFLLVVHWKTENKTRYSNIYWFPAVFGRTSLFSYLTQFVVAMSLPVSLGFKGRLTLPEFFVAFGIIISVCWILSFLYGRARGWITTEASDSIQIPPQKASSLCQ